MKQEILWQMAVQRQMLYPTQPFALAHLPLHCFFVAIAEVQHVLLLALYSAKLQRLSALHAFLQCERLLRKHFRL